MSSNVSQRACKRYICHTAILCGNDPHRHTHIHYSSTRIWGHNILHDRLQHNKHREMVLLHGLCFMTLIASVSFSHIFITMFGSYRVAQIILMVVISVIIVFAGPYINTKTIPVYYIWAPWVSYFAYAFKGSFIMKLLAVFTCDDGVPEASCPVQTDKDAIAYYGLGDYSLVGALFLAYGFLTGWTLVCFVISYFLLRYRRFS